MHKRDRSQSIDDCVRACMFAKQFKLFLRKEDVHVFLTKIYTCMHLRKCYVFIIILVNFSNTSEIIFLQKFCKAQLKLKQTIYSIGVPKRLKRNLCLNLYAVECRVYLFR